MERWSKEVEFLTGSPLALCEFFLLGCDKKLFSVVTNFQPFAFHLHGTYTPALSNPRDIRRSTDLVRFVPLLGVTSAALLLLVIIGDILDIK